MATADLVINGYCSVIIQNMVGKVCCNIQKLGLFKEQSKNKYVIVIWSIMAKFHWSVKNNLILEIIHL